MKLLQPDGWPRPSGYANGISANGRIIVLAGIVGRNSAQQYAAGFVAQFRQILLNILAILATDGIDAGSIVRMTWFVRDLRDYKATLPQLGQVYRELFGQHYPAMSVVGVADLLDPEALLEIETTAVAWP